MPHPLPTIGISSWSLHRRLGISWPHTPANDLATRSESTWGPGELALLDLPGEIAARGIRHLHLCHFHLASREPDYLREVRAAIEKAGVTLEALLIDDGDIAQPDEAVRRRDIDWIACWIVTAAALGARKARVVAGKQMPTPEALARSIAGLRELAKRGKAAGVRVITENWFDTLGGPKEVEAVLSALAGEVGLLADFGNWKGAGKYAALAAILARAEDTHAKAHFEPGGAMDADDFGRCLAAAADAGYRGPYTLIYEGAGGDEWAAIETERAFLNDFLARRAPARKAG